MKKLNKSNIEDILALTPMQEGMLFHYLRDPNSDYYFEQLSLEISGEIDLDFFEKAWNFVIETNEMLRTVFRWEKVEQPIQIILKEHRLQPRYVDLTGKDNSLKKNSLEKIKTKDRKEKFDLREIPFRITLCKVEADKYEMIISNHHILYDGWSNSIIMGEFLIAYNNFLKGNPLKPKLKKKFKEFVKWTQNLRMDTGKQENFWKNYLRGFETQTKLPANLKRKKGGKITNTGTYQMRFGKEVIGKIEGFTRSHQVTLASLLYSAWGILLQKYNNTDDVIFGTTVSGRSAKVKGIEDIVGIFINTLPMRVQTNSNERIDDLLHRIDKTLQIREEYEATSLVNIKEWSEIDAREELFDSIVILENYPLDSRLMLGNSELSIDSYDMVEATHYDLTVGITVLNDIELNVVYNKEIMDEAAVGRVSDHFRCTVENMIKNPRKSVEYIEIISEGEKNKLLYEFNDTEIDFPKDKRVHELFEAQAEQVPNKIAVIGLGEVPLGTGSPWRKREGPGEAPTRETLQLSYQELNRQANQLAHLLRAKGLKPDSIVSIKTARSIEMMVGIWGILKAGGAYLPIDPDYPEERINYILADSGAKILLTDNDLSSCPSWVSSLNCQLSIVNDQLSMSHETQPAASSANLVYIIYTSGSTGKPKGVMMEHRSIVNRLNWMQRFFPIGEEDVILQKTPFVFDVSVWELFWWAIRGGTVCLLGHGEEKNPETIIEAIGKNSVTTMHFVPSMLNVFLEYIESADDFQELRSLRQVFSSGEALRVDQVKKFNILLNKKNGTKLINLYGPTEAAVDVTYFKCLTGKNFGIIPIGKPIDNIGIYILDRALNLQPIHIAGELCISGVGVARGYINNIEGTKGRFITNPFTRGKLLYQTGDLACWLPDGNIEFLGRMDHQVKIRGFRIELGEIENQLMNHKDVKEVVVVVKKDQNNENYLCGYFVADKEITVSDLKVYLSHQLPDYMVPSNFIRLEQLPLTRNGKVDRKVLPEPEGRPQLKEIYVAPQTHMEKIIADAWKQVLKIDRVGDNDNFFDLGGNSLYIIRLSSKLKEVFKREIPVVTLFNHPTVSAQAQYLAGKDTGPPTPIGGAREKEAEEPGGTTGFEIAVIGMAGRFPGAQNIDEFWNNLKEGIESISFFTDEELEALGVDLELLGNPNYVKAKAVLEGCEYFDSSFFDYTKTDVEVMDPQMRIFHECTWQALENAGYDPHSYKGRIGLYAGAAPNLYWEIQSVFSRRTSLSFLEQWEAVQFSNKDYLSTRISYKLNLRGPAVTVQTACSTSLVAIDLACQGLINTTCDMALAGGVSITFHDKGGYCYQEGMIMSPDGHCRVFDKRAEGTVNGNGAGIVLLKPLEEAIADRDTIYAVIKGTAVNNDGMMKVGFTAPGIQGQAEVIRAAHRQAAVEAESINYIETHSTATILGDPIEIEALKLAFDSNKKNFCAIGSVKANIGHLDAAAGVAGFIKTVLAIKHRLIPPGLHFECTNPGIDFKNSPFYVNTELKVWENDPYPLRAGVSSFGIGGTNAHVVLEEWTDGLSSNPWRMAHGAERMEHGSWSQARGEVPWPAGHYQLILLSAKTPTALEKQTKNLEEYFKKNEINLADAAYTLQLGRKVFQQRGMLVCSHVKEAIDRLEAGEVETFSLEEEKRPVVFFFPGQGAQYVNMGRELYQTDKVFRKKMDLCFDILAPIVGYDVKEILYPGKSVSKVSGVSDESASVSTESYIPHINRTEIAQPILFAFEYTLAQRLMTWGIKPYAMMGHSIGEYTAACLAGVFSLEDALTLVSLRGRLMQKMPPGSMLGVPISEEDLQPLLNAELSLAAVNSPSHCVISGTHEAIAAFAGELEERGLQSRRLRTSHAFHSGMMAPILEEFREKIKEIKLNKPEIPYISNLTGNWISGGEAADPRYWGQHLRRTVRFSTGLEKLLKEKNPIFVEVGPGNALSTFLQQHRANENNNTNPLAVNLVRHPKENVADDYYLLRKIGQLWLYGIKIDWRGFHAGEKRYRIPLPTYPFEGKHFRVEKDSFESWTGISSGNSLLRRKPDIAEWFYTPSWERVVLPPPKALQNQGHFHWLVFSDTCGLGSKLVKELKRDDRDVVTVLKGLAFVKVDDNTYTINPAGESDYNALFDELVRGKKVPDRIYHLWSITKPGIEAVSEALDSGFFSLLYLARAIGRQDVTAGIQIEVITNNIHEVTGEEKLCPEKGPVVGLCKVVPLEYPNISCRCIDILLPENSAAFEKKTIHSLLSGFSAKSSSPVMAYRGSYGWMQTFKPVRLERPDNETFPLRERGVYLVIGGLGEIGLIWAEYLAKTVKAKLILTHRSIFPLRNEWEQWLFTHHSETSIGRKIKKLRKIEEMGAEVLVVRADVSHPGQMQHMIKQAEDIFGSINGVIHSAGLVGEKSRQAIKDITTAECQLQFQAKVYGLLVLERILWGREPDFCLLMSSMASILGGVGFAAHAAANFFMDTFVHQRNRRGPTRWISVNWGEWKLEEQGMASFQRILSCSGADHVIQWTGDLPTLVNRGMELESFPTLQQEDNFNVKDSTLQEARPNLSTPYATPNNRLQQVLVDTWKKLLGFERIGVRDNFFELGGDSLKAAILISKIHKEFNIEIKLKDFFFKPTIEGLAQHMSHTGTSSYFSIGSAEEREYYLLSPAQERMFIINQLENESTGYNVTAGITCEGELDKEKMENVFRKLLRRHESLRTSIIIVEDEPVQKIHEYDQVEFEIEYDDLTIEDTKNKNYKLQITNKKETGTHHSSFIIHHSFIRPFDLSKAPLLRVGLIKIEKEKHLLMVDMHHIIVDGFSQAVLTRDFISMYEGKELPGLRLQYKDYAEWRNRKQERGLIIKQEEYWLKQFEGEIPILDLPTDYVRPEVPDFEGSMVEFEIGREDSSALKKLALDEGVTLYMVLLAIYNILLSKISNKEDIIVGTPIAGRSHPNLESIIGMFVNSLALRNFPGGERTFKEFLSEVKKRTLEAFENQHYQFEDLVEKVILIRDISRNPLFDVMFDFRIADFGAGMIPEEITGGLKIKMYKSENTTSKVDLILIANEVDGRIHFNLEYSTSLYKKETMDLLLRFYEKIIKLVLENKEIKIKNIELIDEDENCEIRSKIQVDLEEIDMNTSIEFDI